MPSLDKEDLSLPKGMKINRCKTVFWLLPEHADSLAKDWEFVEKFRPRFTVKHERMLSTKPRPDISVNKIAHLMHIDFANRNELRSMLQFFAGSLLAGKWPVELSVFNPCLDDIELLVSRTIRFNSGGEVGIYNRYRQINDEDFVRFTAILSSPSRAPLKIAELHRHCEQQNFFYREIPAWKHQEHYRQIFRKSALIAPNLEEEYSKAVHQLELAVS